MADSDRKRKEVDSDPSSSGERKKKSKRTTSLIDAVQSWIGSSSSSGIRANKDEGVNENNNKDKKYREEKESSDVDFTLQDRINTLNLELKAARAELETQKTAVEKFQGTAKSSEAALAKIRESRKAQEAEIEKLNTGVVEMKKELERTRNIATKLTKEVQQQKKLNETQKQALLTQLAAQKAAIERDRLMKEKVTKLEKELNSVKKELNGGAHDRCNKTALEDLKKATHEADKMRRIEFAVQRLDAGGVEVNGISSDFQPRKATEGRYMSWGGSPAYRYEVTSLNDWQTTSLLRNILWSFRGGQGYSLEEKEYFIADDCGVYVNGIEEEWYENFHKAIIKKIHKLLGKEPRCEYTDDGETMTLYYE